MNALKHGLKTHSPRSTEQPQWTPQKNRFHLSEGHKSRGMLWRHTCVCIKESHLWSSTVHLKSFDLHCSMILYFASKHLSHLVFSRAKYSPEGRLKQARNPTILLEINLLTTIPLMLSCRRKYGDVMIRRCIEQAYSTFYKKCLFQVHRKYAAHQGITRKTLAK